MKSKVIIVLGVSLLLVCLYIPWDTLLREDSCHDDLKHTIRDLKALLRRQNSISVLKYIHKNQTTVSVLRFEYGEWRHDNEICSALAALKGTKSFEKVFLKSDFVGGMPIYIHNPKIDGISRKVLTTSNFEPHVFKTLHAVFVTDPEISLIDIGANIGVNALQAASYGINTIAMEATKESTQHLCASSTENYILDKLTIVNNAVSNNHDPVKVVHANIGGFGGAFLDEDPELHKLKIRNDGNVFNFTKFSIMKTVILDDVLDLHNGHKFKHVLIKMDVEGWEHKVFEGAVQFFRKMSVVGVLMEYRWHVGRPSRKPILAFFEKFEYDPFSFTGGTLLPLNAETMEDHDVLWLYRHRTFWKNANGIKLW